MAGCFCCPIQFPEFDFVQSTEKERGRLKKGAFSFIFFDKGKQIYVNKKALS
jgi:hypothetical protein